MRFDWLVVGPDLASNPVSSAHGPMPVAKTENTLALSATKTQTLRSCALFARAAGERISDGDRVWRPTASKCGPGPGWLLGGQR